MQSRESSISRLHLPGGEPAVAISLMVSHGCFWVLPASISTDLLYELTIHCKRFEKPHLLSGILGPYLERLLPKALETGSIRWLYIAWVFRLELIFQSHPHYLIGMTEKNRYGRLALNPISVHAQELMSKCKYHKWLTTTGGSVSGIIERSRVQLFGNIPDICMSKTKQIGTNTGNISAKTTTTVATTHTSHSWRRCAHSIHGPTRCQPRRQQKPRLVFQDYCRT